MHCSGVAKVPARQGHHSTFSAGRACPDHHARVPGLFCRCLHASNFGALACFGLRQSPASEAAPMMSLAGRQHTPMQATRGTVMSSGVARAAARSRRAGAPQRFDRRSTPMRASSPRNPQPSGGEGTACGPWARDTHSRPPCEVLCRALLQAASRHWQRRRWSGGELWTRSSRLRRQCWACLGPSWPARCSCCWAWWRRRCWWGGWWQQSSCCYGWRSGRQCW